MIKMSSRELPKYVSKCDRGYVLRPYKGTRGGRPVFGRREVIAPPDATLDEVWKAWEVVNSDVFTVGWLLREYHAGEQYARLSSKTHEDYSLYRQSLLNMDIEGGTFARVDLGRINKRTIRNFLDNYKGGAHPVAANRRMAYFKSAWNWAEERHDIPANPCIGVRMNKESPRERYVTDEEYNAVLRLAPLPIRQMMELAYLCRARRSEVLALTVDDIEADGLRLVRLKGSEGEITAWCGRLRAAISDVRAEPYICHRYTKSGFASAWVRLMAKAEREGVERFTFHDLKAKGVSDHASNHSGHRSGNMRKVYVRKLQLVQATA